MSPTTSDATQADCHEDHARALLTIAAIETRLQTLEKYLASNGEYLPLDARVPLRHTCEAFRAALDKWRADD